MAGLVERGIAPGRIRAYGIAFRGKEVLVGVAHAQQDTAANKLRLAAKGALSRLPGGVPSESFAFALVPPIRRRPAM